MATVVLASPETRNLITADLAAELRQAAQAVQEQQDRIHALVLTGSGGVFSAGRATPPAGAASKGAPLAWLEQLQVASAIADLPVPVIVAVNGDALDHGLELSLAGDLRIAAPHARFGLTDLAQGAFPWDGGTQRLPRLVGAAWAHDMILTSRVIDASEALALGLVNRVVAEAELQAQARQLAETIAAGGPVAARYAREAVHQGMDLTLPQGLRLEADLNIILHSTTDRAEGIRSFLERRRPDFTGR